MQKETLKIKHDELVKKIIENSKDSKLARELISDLFSVIGQIEHKPSLLSLPLEDVVDSFEGDTFRMQLMKDGTTVYHVKGGMDIVAKPNLASLNQTMSSLIQESHQYASMSEDEKNAFDTEMQATAYVLNIPMIAFSDIDFMFDTASSVIKFLNQKMNESMEAPLQTETPLEDKQFEEATMALEEINKEIQREDSYAGEDND